MKTKFHAVVAYTRHTACIGLDNKLPWPPLKSDMSRFRRITRGHPVIMGRKTWDSIGKPLEGRTNIILSRSMKAAPEGTILARDLMDVVDLCEGCEVAYVIGGADIYRQMMPMISAVYATEVDIAAEGDAHFPDLPIGQWSEFRVEQITDPSGVPLRFIDYARKGDSDGRG